jgi:hypothetical protein
MKHADVKVGGEYLTRISGELVPVVVVRQEAYVVRGKVRHSFRCRRAGEERVLPKCRSAASLRPVEAGKRPPPAYD